MDDKKRPVSREKRNSGKTGHIGKTENSGGRLSGMTRSPLGILLIVGALLFGGGEGLATIMGGDTATNTPISTPVATVAPTATPTVTSTNPHTSLNIKPNGSQTATANNTVNTTVASGSRDKRTVIKGNNKDEVTVMIYMCGSDLESRGGYATQDLQEMANAKWGDNMHVVVFTGGAKQWRNNVMTAGKYQMWEIKDGKFEKLNEKNAGGRAMTDPSVLSEFIKTAAAKFPANRYELIFWDHGAGSVSGYGYDETNKNAGTMTLDKISTALKDGGVTFDTIGFDACLMATLETALVLEPYADYMIASEEVEPGCGWYYTNWLNKLGANTSTPTLEVGKTIIDDFITYVGQKCYGQQGTLSMLDLAELSKTVPSSFMQFAKSTSNMIRNDKYGEVSQARANTKEFAKSQYIDQVDLIHLADNIDSKEGEALIKALKSVVKYNKTTNNIANANGVSIYFPYSSTNKVSSMVQTYNKIGLEPEYVTCVKDFASTQGTGQIYNGGQAGNYGSLFDMLAGSSYGSDISDGFSYSSSLPGLGDLVGIDDSGMIVVDAEDVMGLLFSTLLSGRSIPELGLEADETDFFDTDVAKGNQKYVESHMLDKDKLVWTEKNGQQVLVLSEEEWQLINTIELNVFVGADGGYYDMGLDNVLSFNTDGDLVADFDKSWLSLNGMFVSYYMTSVDGDQDDYTIMGRIPALLSSDEYDQERVNVIVQFTDEDPYGKVLGASLVYTDVDTVSRGLIELNEGDTLEFIHEFYNEKFEHVSNEVLGSLEVTGDFYIENMYFDNDSYVATYRITDIYGNQYWMPEVK